MKLECHLVARHLLSLVKLVIRRFQFFYVAAYTVVYTLSVLYKRVHFIFLKNIYFWNYLYMQFAPFKLKIQRMFSPAICLVLMQLRKCCQFHVISNRNYLCSYSDRIYEAYANIITSAPLMTLTKPFY